LNTVDLRNQPQKTQPSLHCSTPQNTRNASL